jgi:CRP-like cAMP-binding protein
LEPTSPVYKNRVLASLSRSDLNRLKPHLSPVELNQYTPLLDGDNSYGYFLEEGLASVVVTVENGATVEVGVVGIEGVVGIPILLGAMRAPGRTFMQIAGKGFRIGVPALQKEFERPGELRQYLQRYMHGFMVQTAQTAVCNRLHGIEERLSRWLLTCRDRIPSDELRLTHDFLGQMLGAPRSTVTLAAGMLHRAGLIDYFRGVVTIKNRTELGKVACECYRTVRDEFQRLELL